MALSVVALSNNERHNIWQDNVAEQQETNIIKKRPGQPKLRASTRILSKPKFAALWTNAKLNRTHLDGHAYVQCLYGSVCLCMLPSSLSHMMLPYIFIGSMVELFRPLDTLSRASNPFIEDPGDHFEPPQEDLQDKFRWKWHRDNMKMTWRDLYWCVIVWEEKYMAKLYWYGIIWHDVW